MYPSDELTPVPEAVELRGGDGFSVSIVNLGATIHSIGLPVDGNIVNPVLSYADISGYQDDTCYLGATVGRFANRIRNARLSLDGKRIDLDANESSTGHCLHGGAAGISRQFFTLDVAADQKSVTCRHVSAAGAGGFPGCLKVLVVYRLTDVYSLAIDYYAETDHDTVVSLANHAYFNLGGHIDDHELRVLADEYTPVDSTSIPTGEIRSVAGGEFDLREPGRLGARRFDHNFVLPPADGTLRLAAELHSPASEIGLKLHTTQPGLQLYTGDYLEAPFARRQGLCLEAQGFPDAPNQPHFPSVLLKPGMEYFQRTVYEFNLTR